MVLTAKGPVIAGTAVSDVSETGVPTVFAARIAEPSTAPPAEPAKPTPPAPVQEVERDVNGFPPPVSIADVVVFPSARRCVSRRRFRIRLREGVRTLSATVSVNGRQVRVVRGKRLRAPVDLRGLPKGRFKVRISLALEDGRTITGSRRYRTCAK